MSDCVFCNIAAKTIPSYVVYENEDILAFLDVKPVNIGHTLVVPKAHFPDLLATPDDVMANVFAAVKKVAKAATDAVQAGGFNVGINTGRPAGQVVFHTHVHVMPRFENDGHQHWAKKQVPEQEMVRIAEEIRRRL